MKERNKVVDIPTSWDSTLTVEAANYEVKDSKSVIERGKEITLLIQKNTGSGDDGMQAAFLSPNQALYLISVLTDKVREILYGGESHDEADKNNDVR